MGFPLFDLPDELIVQVLCQLSPWDINRVFDIPEMAQRFKKFVRLVTQADPIIFSNIPVESQLRFDPKKDDELPTGGLLRLFEVVDFHPFIKKISKKIDDDVPKMLVVHDDPYLRILAADFDQNDDAISNHAFEKLVENHSKQNPRLFKQLFFTTVLRLDEVNLELDPSSLYFPNLHHALFDSCTSADESRKFYFPKLVTLDYNGIGYKSFSKSLNFNSLTEIFLSNIDDKVHFANITFPNLTSLTVLNKNSRSIHHSAYIKNCKFPELKFFEVDTSGVIVIDRSEFPGLHTIRFKTLLEIILLEFELPELQYIELESKTFLVQNVQNFPKLKHLYLDVENFEAPQNKEFFQSVSSIWVNNHFLKFLKFLGDTNHIRYFGARVYEKDIPLIPEMDELNVKTAELILMGEELNKIPKLNTPKLKFLKVTTFALEKLDNLEIDYPNIEDLTLICNDTKLGSENFNHPNLKSLKLDITTQPLDFNGSFDNLETIFIHRDNKAKNLQHIEEPVTINLKAPNLLSLVFDYLEIDTLTLLDFPKLQKLTVSSMKNLIAPNLISLIDLEIIGSDMELLKLRAPNLETFDPFNTMVHTLEMDTGFGLSSELKREKFGSDYKPELEDIIDYAPWYIDSHLEKIIEDLPYYEKYSEIQPELFEFEGKIRQIDLQSESLNNDERDIVW
ncbi:hypothetical protein BN7_321 [Wickerhamomyces ciferrii]|uniref:F-box domain-containing protein n=1 Tax=Wickerhamomyces ciferrii (strain ATCC 14091 / BCRC 22168 / CBS 111 / JCM 3599 / NBRC 0793 / NRRL Y-1031 F-60-10) TaxID=1206466 RepID=K0KF12_WICCF|nr:uncharacterized protein BN7_321 [Wickerhamomyces ciferrii]CCH40787.1 hypothetical protein BN7_321 [Wickerhamomyces ciferrii]